MKIKEEIKKIKKLKGKTRGQEIKNNFKCIENLEGEEARKKVEERLDDFNMLPEYENYEDFEWYPIKFDVATIIVAKEVLGWGTEELKRHGRNLVKLSFIQKMFVKYFISVDKMLENANRAWERFFNIGKLEIKKGKEGKMFRAQLKGFDIHPYYCKIVLGYFEKTLSLIISSNKIEGMETKCTFRGDKFHEFIVRYE